MARRFPTLRVVAWWELVTAGVFLAFSMLSLGHQQRATWGPLNSGEVLALLQNLLLCNAAQAVAAALALLLPTRRHRRRRAAGFVAHAALAVLQSICGRLGSLASLLAQFGPLNLIAAAVVAWHVSAAVALSLWCGLVAVLLRGGGWAAAVEPSGVSGYQLTGAEARFILHGLRLCSAAQAVAAGMALLLPGRRRRRRAAAFVALAVDPVIQCLGGRLALALFVINEGPFSIIGAAAVAWHISGAVTLAAFCCVVLLRRGRM